MSDIETVGRVIADDRPGVTRPGVLVIYTGGTIGSKPRDPDPDSPQVVVPWEALKAGTPEIARLPFAVDCFSIEPPLDSCNIGPVHWTQMANAIYANYDNYTGFVILHGTDTMVYTASALSFILRDLGKPVVLTGAQRSALVSTRNDATQNFLTALEIANPPFANIPVVPEVCIFFGGKLLRGNRTIKEDTSGYEAYVSPNLELLGEVGDRIVINEKNIRPLPERGRRLTLRSRPSTSVLPVFVYPGIQDNPEILRAQLETPGLKAAVVLSFGSGNIPTDEKFLDVFRSARERGILLADVSQCPRGPVELGIYETSEALLEIGFVAGADVTVEAAQCKLMTLFGQDGITCEEVEEEFQENLAGEHSFSVFVTRWGAGSGGELSGAGERARTRPVQLAGKWTPQRVDRAIVRLRGAQAVGPPAASEAKPLDQYKVQGDQPAVADPKGYVEFSVYLNLDAGATPDESSPNFAGRYKTWPLTRKSTMFVDISRAIRETSEAGDRVSITVFLHTAEAQLSWEAAEMAIFNRELAQ
jgi:L-asparaginase